MDMATGLPPRAVMTAALLPVARIFMPLRSSMLLTGLPAVCSLPGPWAWKYRTWTSSNSLGLNFSKTSLASFVACTPEV